MLFQSPLTNVVLFFVIISGWEQEFTPAMGLRSWLEKREGGVWGVIVVISAFMIQIPSFGTAQSFGIYNMFFIQYFVDESPATISLIGSINVGVFLGSGKKFVFL